MHRRCSAGIRYVRFYRVESTAARGCSTTAAAAACPPRQLADAGVEVVGVDESAVMLELAAARLPKLRSRAGTCTTSAPTSAASTPSRRSSRCSCCRALTSRTPLRGLGARLNPGGLLALGMVASDLDAVEIPFLGVPVAVSAYPSDELAGVVAAAGFHHRDGLDVATEGGRVETQQFLLARRE
jgi:hypothetical protein